MEYLIPLIKVLLALVLGFFIGYEREKLDKNAGIKTSILVCAGACIFTILSLENATKLSDPTRIAAQVVSGIGFLGAGAILKDGLIAKGLTTASIIWFTAGVGMCVGFGNYYLAIISTVLMQISIYIAKKVDSKIRKKKKLNRKNKNE